MQYCMEGTIIQQHFICKLGKPIYIPVISQNLVDVIIVYGVNIRLVMTAIFCGERIQLFRLAIWKGHIRNIGNKA